MRVVVPLVVLAAVYAALCAWRPLVRCSSCRGALLRRRRGPRWLAILADRFRGPALCRRCRGRGVRIRLGRRAYDHLRRLQKAGSR